MIQVSQSTTWVMDRLFLTMPEVRVTRVKRLVKVVEAERGPDIASEVEQWVDRRGRTLGWWP